MPIASRAVPGVQLVGAAFHLSTGTAGRETLTTVTLDWLQQLHVKLRGNDLGDLEPSSLPPRSPALSRVP